MENNVPIDLSLENLLILKKENSVKFIYCPNFIHFTNFFEYIVKNGITEFGKHYEEIKNNYITKV
jgi:hypothetical protein